jgi:hypothetical protein
VCVRARAAESAERRKEGRKGKKVAGACVSLTK